MSTLKTIAKNTGWLMIADIISRVLSFFLIIAIARYLGDSGLGKYSFVFAYVGLFSLFSDLGLSYFMVREVSRHKEKIQDYFGNILSLKLILGILTIVAALIIILFIDNSKETVIGVLIISFATLFLNFNTLFGALFQTFEKMEYISWMVILERVITVSLGIYTLLHLSTITTLFLVFLASYFTIFCFSYILAIKKITPFSFKFDVGFWKDLIKHSLPFWFTNLFIAIYFRIDAVMLSIMTNYEIVGWYSAAYKSLDALYFIPGSVIVAMFPVMSRLHITNKAVLKEVYEKAFYYLLLIALPIGIGTTLLAERIVLFVYKEKFINSVPALQILIWAEVIIFVSYLAGYLLNSINKEKLFTYTAGFGALLNIILNLFLIYYFSYIGAAIATVITELTIFVTLFYFATKYGYKINVFKIVIKPLIAAMVMTFAIFFLSSLHILAIIIISALIYFSVLFLIRGVGKEEVDLIKLIIIKN